MVIENVELNPDIDDSLFHFPTKLIKPKILLPNLKRRLHDDEKASSRISSAPGRDVDGSSR
jgi:hypothetical protein